MEGTSDKLGRGMLVLPTWGVSKPVKTAIVGLSEGATTTRDNLPTVGTIRTNGSPSALNTEVDMGHHMGMLRPISGVSPTNNSVMALSKPVRIAIIGLRERATTIQDKLLTVETTRTNGLLRTRVAIDHHMDKLRVMSVTPNNKAMAASGAMKWMTLTASARNNTKGIVTPNTPRDHLTRRSSHTVPIKSRNIKRATGIPDLVTSIVALRRVEDTTVTGAPTGAAMNTEKVTFTVNARRVMDAANTNALVAGTRGLHNDNDTTVLRARATEEGRGPMDAMKTAMVPLVSKGSIYRGGMKMTPGAEGTIVTSNGMRTGGPNTEEGWIVSGRSSRDVR